VTAPEGPPEGEHATVKRVVRRCLWRPQMERQSTGEPMARPVFPRAGDAVAVVGPSSRSVAVDRGPDRFLPFPILVHRVRVRVRPGFWVSCVRIEVKI
jgi:hypothetical protein